MKNSTFLPLVKGSILTVGKRAKSKKAAFTLIELLIVISIIAILATIIIVSFSNARVGSQTAVAKSTLQTFKKAIMLYQNETGKMPYQVGDTSFPRSNAWCKPGWPTRGGAGTGTCLGELSNYIGNYNKEGPYSKCTSSDLYYANCYNYYLYGNNVMLLMVLNPRENNGPLNGTNLPNVSPYNYCDPSRTTYYCDGYKYK